MSGKKLVGIVIAVVIVVCLSIVLAITLFYKNNEEQPNRENREENKSKSLGFISPQVTITLNSR
ncbi:MAG: hypothetical protein RR595_04475 [Lysinibacillus sp.]